MSHWTIRPAEKGDVEALTACIDAAYADARIRVADLPDVSTGLHEDIEHHRVWVAIVKEVVVGGVVLILKDRHAVLANVAVDPAHSRMGLGRGLLEQAEAACRNHGLSELRLTTHAGMPENVELYNHLGWEEIERSGSKVIMSKRL